MQNLRPRAMRGGRHPGLLVMLLFSMISWASAPDSKIADAAQRDNVPAVRSLISQAADVNGAQGDGMTAMHWASVNGNTELVELLIRSGAGVSARTRLGGYTPLHLAARAGHAPVVAKLLAAGARVADATTSGGTLPLHFAAASGNAAAVAAILDHGAEINARESVSQQTPLMWAAASGRSEAVQLLLQRGADFSAVTTVVDVPELAAADRQAGQRRDEVLKALRAQSEQPESWRPTTRDVEAALRAARESPEEVKGDAEQRERVLRAARAELGPNADPTQRLQPPAQAPPQAPQEGGSATYPNLVGHTGGLTALLYAVREGHGETARFLLEAGADINQKSAGDQTSPLLMSLINGHFDLALQLLERGADPNAASEAGTTPLYAALNTHWAPKARYPQQQAYRQAHASYLDVLKALLGAGADPNVRLAKHLWYMSYTFDLLGVDTEGSTPFWRAAYACDVDAMRLLIAHGADPNIPTKKPAERRRRARSGTEGDPSGLPPIPEGGPAVWPIHAASGVGYGEGYAGNAHRHVPEGWLPAVKYLVEELGADVNARDHNGYTPLHHAAARGDNELILYLVSKGADVTAVSRRGQTTADMANGPVQRIQPFPETVALLEKLGSKNNHRCVSC